MSGQRSDAASAIGRGGCATAAACPSADKSTHNRHCHALEQESAARRWRGGRYIFSTGRMVLWNTEPTDQASSSSHEVTPVASRRDSRKKYCRSPLGKPERTKRERFFRRWYPG